MRKSRRILLVVMMITFVMTSLPALAQTLLGTVTVGVDPIAIAHNGATNKIYVANYCGNDSSCASSGTVTVIDGATNETVTLTAGVYPYDVRVNAITNKAYDVELCGNDLTCQSNGTVTVIDGATNNTSTVQVGFFPFQAAVNQVTNKIYVSNGGEGTVTIIDGATNQTSTISVGNGPAGLAVNSVTNKIYVPNYLDNTVTVIDGQTLATSVVTAGINPFEVAVNSVTNKIYVANEGDNTVTVIDGATNNPTTVQVDLSPYAVAVNQVTNQIYVANSGSDTVTVIDGNTLTPTPVMVGNSPLGVAINPVTNDIYVPNFIDNTMSMINGANNNTTTTPIGNSPYAIDANVVTNRIYVANAGDGTVSVLGGPSATALQFVPLAPCRLVDTRKSGGPITGGTSESFALPQEGSCGGSIPANAAAYSLNVTVVPSGPLGYLTIWPTGEDQPVVSTMNSLDGRIKANAAIVPAGYQGAVSVYVSNTTNIVLDIDGYFAPPSSQTLQFYPLTPCRVLDTRKTNGPLGGPFLNGGQERDFPVLASSCGIPSSAKAYSMNFTVVPVNGQALGYLTVWPQGAPQPTVSTLNNLTATIVANAAIVPAGGGGEIATYASQNTQLVGDIDGYFAAPQSGLSLYAVAPCRVIDTRKIGTGQPFSGLLTPPVDVVDSVCAPPDTSQGYVFNATVVPSGSLGYLTLWPDSENQPVVSTLNAIDGAITSNMAIVPNVDGKTDAYASGTTQLILDISGYFAP